MTSAPSTTKVIVESKTFKWIALIIEEIIENIVKVEVEVCIELRVFTVKMVGIEE